LRGRSARAPAQPAAAGLPGARGEAHSARIDAQSSQRFRCARLAAPGGVAARALPRRLLRAPGRSCAGLGRRGFVSFRGLVGFWRGALAAYTRRSRRQRHQDDIQADRRVARAPETPAVAAHRAAWRQRRRRAPAARRPRAGARPSRRCTTPPGPPSWPRPSCGRPGAASCRPRRRRPSRPQRRNPTASSRPRRERRTSRMTTSPLTNRSGSRR